VYELSGVTKIYQKGRATVTALDSVDVTIPDGEWLAIQGPTGHGKTTLLQMLGGLDRPTAGVVDLGGRESAPLSSSPGGVGGTSAARIRPRCPNARSTWCEPALSASSSRPST
jgi:ABC-type dipeptide/oligopeptide/nickel transport system ATPase subunit